MHFVRFVAHRKSIGRRLWRYRWPLLFISPFYILFLVFGLYPMLYSAWLSLNQWPGIGPMQYVGPTNYRQLLQDDIFWSSVWNVAIMFVMYVPLAAFLAVVLATLLNGRFLRLQGLWRAMLILPFITSGVATAYTFRMILDNNGILNHLLALVGLPAVMWLDGTWTARISVSLLVLWNSLGFNTLIMLAGLQAISADVVEAAKVDGAGRLQIFWRITIPLLRPSIVFILTLSVIGGFQLYTEPYVLTHGGPANATLTPVMQIFNASFRDLQFSYGATMSWAFFVLILIATLVQYRFANRREISS